MLIEASPALVQSSQNAGGSEPAVSSIAVGFGNGSKLLIITEPPIAAATIASEADQSNGPTGAGISQAVSSVKVDRATTLELLQAPSGTAPEGVISNIPFDASSGTAGFAAEMGGSVDGTTLVLADDGETPVFPPFPGLLSAPGMWRANSLESSNDDDPDISYSGPLEPILEAATLSALSTTTPALGRALTQVITGRSLQLDSYVEGANSSGLSYLATGQGSALLFQSSAGDDLLAWEEATSEPVAPGSITTGGLSLINLLSGPDSLTQPDPVGIEQVAELVPLPESSLALAATLWTVPSDSPTSSLRSNRPTEPATDANARARAVSSWMLFVAGVDEALEQTCRELQENIPTCRGRQHDGNPNSPYELLEWQGPILPGAQRALPAARTKLPETRRGQSDGVAGQGSEPTQHAAQPTRDDGQAVVLAAMPTISVASVFTVIAAWIWRKRQQWRPSWLSGRVSRRRLFALKQRTQGSA